MMGHGGMLLDEAKAKAEAKEKAGSILRLALSTSGARRNGNEKAMNNEQ